MEPFVHSASLLYLLLNPVLMSVYLMVFIDSLDRRTFAQVMRRAHFVSLIVFGGFAIAGTAMFEKAFGVRFGSFLIFGGLVFLAIGFRSVFAGSAVLVETRGEPSHVSGSAAMPFMIGPGTISASVLAGAQLPGHLAIGAVATALVGSYLSIVFFKDLLDAVRKRNEVLVRRYVDVAGRVVALFTGTYAIEMIVRGVEALVLNQAA